MGDTLVKHEVYSTCATSFGATSMEGQIWWDFGGRANSRHDHNDRWEGNRWCLMDGKCEEARRHGGSPCVGQRWVVATIHYKNNFLTMKKIFIKNLKIC